MGWPQFLAWAATQGFKHTKFLRQAYNSFKGKLPGKDVILKTARNFYDKAIAKVPTKQIADKIRQDIKGAKRTPLDKARWDKVWKQFDKGKPTLKPSGPGKVIPFPKKPPGKADGGRIDKALPTRSRDI